MARQHGSKGQVLIDPAGGTTYVAVASLTSWTLDASRDRADVTAFGDTNKQAVQGLPNYTGTIGYIWDPTTTPTQLWDVVLGDVAVGLKLVPSTLTATNFFSGLAYLDGSINVSSSGAITGSASWVAAGNWTLAP
jgi:hypothetical protein